MIQRKIDSLGNVSGFYDTERQRWVKETSFDETTDLSGKVLDPRDAQVLVDRRAKEQEEALEQANPERAQAAQDEVDAEAEEVAADADDDGEPMEVDPNDLTKEQLIKALEAKGIVSPKNATKLQLVELYEQNQEV